MTETELETLPAGSVVLSTAQPGHGAFENWNHPVLAWTATDRPHIGRIWLTHDGRNHLSGFLIDQFGPITLIHQEST